MAGAPVTFNLQSPVGKSKKSFSRALKKLTGSSEGCKLVDPQLRRHRFGVICSDDTPDPREVTEVMLRRTVAQMQEQKPREPTTTTNSTVIVISSSVGPPLCVAMATT
ncbi:hypothetical protein EYF80_008251 [Liparis tanakae]|uniref:Uncharacterized protein n=1 Tax=Liparis tanakae TaxID=230148 RepID=A0A4Z2ITY7_9TELE|nr:hypothetical protein EYF80_008251 [Liparis tanakae]